MRIKSGRLVLLSTPVGIVLFLEMTVTEIILELPRLSPEERSTLARKLKELDEGELNFLHEAADSMFLEMDREEEQNASQKRG
jgi:hypothetical protein